MATGLNNRDRGMFKITTSATTGKAAVVKLKKDKYPSAVATILGLSEVTDEDSVTAPMSPIQAVRSGVLGVITAQYKGGTGTSTTGSIKLYCSSDEIDSAIAKLSGKTIGTISITGARVAVRRRLY